MLSAFITSKARRKVLSFFLAHPTERFHVREIARKTKENINAVRRELKKLENAGFLIAEKEANLVYFKVDRGMPIYEELKRIYLKTDGAGNVIREHLGDLGRFIFVFIYGSYAKGEESSSSDLDLFIVGDISEERLISAVNAIEEKLSREVNYVMFTPKEFRDRKRAGDSFIENVMKEKRIMLLGDDDELLKLGS